MLFCCLHSRASENICRVFHHPALYWFTRLISTQYRYDFPLVAWPRLHYSFPGCRSTDTVRITTLCTHNVPKICFKTPLEVIHENTHRRHSPFFLPPASMQWQSSRVYTLNDKYIDVRELCKLDGTTVWNVSYFGTWLCIDGVGLSHERQTLRPLMDGVYRCLNVGWEKVHNYSLELWQPFSSFWGISAFWGKTASNWYFINTGSRHRQERDARNTGDGSLFNI